MARIYFPTITTFTPVINKINEIIIKINNKNST